MLARFSFLLFSILAPGAQAQSPRHLRALDALLAHGPGESISARAPLLRLLTGRTDTGHHPRTHGHWNAHAVCLSQETATRCTVLGVPDPAPTWLPRGARMIEPLIRHHDEVSEIEAACLGRLTLEQGQSEWSLDLSLMTVDVDNLPVPHRNFDKDTGMEIPLVLPSLATWEPSRHSGVFAVHRMHADGTIVRTRTQSFGANFLENELEHAVSAWDSATWLEEASTEANPWPANTSLHCETIETRADVLLCRVPAELLFGYTRAAQGTDLCRVWRRAFDGETPLVLFTRN